MEIKIDRIAYTSDGKRKTNNFMLRTLISDNLLQNNFASLQSQRINSPNKGILMYPERIRQKLYPQTVKNFKRKNSENKGIIIEDRVKQTAINMKNMRVMSSNQENRGSLRKRSESLQFLTSKQRSQREAPRPMTVSKDGKIKMKKLLGRLNLLARDQLTLEDDEQIEVIFQFLEALSKNQNYYQQAFTYINKKLSSLIFLPSPNQRDKNTMNLRKVAEITKNHNIISMIYPTTNQKSTYQQLLTLFTQQIFTLTQKSKKQQNLSNQQIQSIFLFIEKDFQSLIKQKQELISNLTHKLNFYQSHPSQNKYPQLQQIKQQNKLLKTQYEQQLYKIKVLEHNLQLLHQTKIMHQNKIESLKKQIARYELQKLSNVKQVQKSSQLKVFEDNVTMLKQMLDRSIIRMGGMKQEYDKLKNYNQTLINQRDNFAKRAAVGFGQLTPRPNLKKIFENHKMSFTEVFDTELSSSKKTDKKLISTQKFVDTLIGKFKNYYQTYKIQQKQTQLSKKVKKSTKDKQKQKAKEKQKNKDIFQTVMDQVYEAKSQINKTMQSVQQVRIAYNKKQQDLFKK